MHGDDRSEFEDLGLDPELERLIGTALSQVQPSEAFARGLRLRLQENFARRRAWYRRPAWALPAVVLFCVLGFGALKLIPWDTGLPGTTGYESTAQDWAVITNDSTLGPEHFENVARLQTEQEGTLLKVYGLTLRGRTQMTLSYAYGIDDRQVIVSRVAPAPYDSPSMDQVEFMKAHLAEFVEMIENGTAMSIGTENVFIGGQAVTLHRWRAEFPGWGTAIYFYGSPLSPPTSKN
jgi:hypothetical protein